MATENFYRRLWRGPDPSILAQSGSRSAILSVEAADDSGQKANHPRKLMLLLSLALSLMALLQDQPAFKVDANFVKVPVSVLDTNGRSIPNLTKEDFVLLDEGVERKIHNFVLDESPVHVVFLLDTSGSLTEELDQIHFATLRFAQAFDRDDRIAVISFADEVVNLVDWTNDYGHLRKGLKRLKRGYRTALYDAVFKTAKEKLAEVSGKKVVILLTDGLDNESETTYENVKNELISSNTVLYVVSRTRIVQSKIAQNARIEFLEKVMKNVLGDDESYLDIYFREKEAALNYLAEINGGRVFYPQQLQDFGTTYMQIARELKTQYVLTFSPPEERVPEFRHIEVLCKKEVGSVYHREIYRAPD